MDEEWWLAALCARFDPDVWSVDGRGNAAAALTVCGHCPVRQPCLAEAVRVEAADRGEPRGVRGGLTARQRRPLVTRRRKELRLAVTR